MASQVQTVLECTHSLRRIAMAALFAILHTVTALVFGILRNPFSLLGLLAGL
jgi:hypothetical protein